jgi:hypothetical protein
MGVYKSGVIPCQRQRPALTTFDRRRIFAHSKAFVARQQRAVNVSPSRPIENASRAAKSRTLPRKPNWLHPKQTFLEGRMPGGANGARGGLSVRSYNTCKINDLWLPRIPLLYQPNVPASVTEVRPSKPRQRGKESQSSLCRTIGGAPAQTRGLGRRSPLSFGRTIGNRCTPVYSVEQKRCEDSELKRWRQQAKSMRRPPAASVRTRRGFPISHSAGRPVFQAQSGCPGPQHDARKPG